MQSYFILYSTLAVFGIGVTIIDLFGVFDQASQDSSTDNTADTDLESDIGEAGQPEEADADDEGDSEADSPSGTRGSWVVSGETGTRIVAKAIGTLRTGVYFSLGAGPTGLFAILTGVRGLASLAWSAGAGIFIAILSKALRSLVRKDLDSSIHPEEFLMDQATISVIVSPGAMGKAIVARYGRETELYVRCKDPDRALSKGELVRIVDLDGDCYWVEPQA